MRIKSTVSLARETSAWITARLAAHCFFRSSSNVQGRTAPPMSLRLMNANNIAREECIMVTPAPARVFSDWYNAKEPGEFQQGGAFAPDQCMLRRRPQPQHRQESPNAQITNATVPNTEDSLQTSS